MQIRRHRISLLRDFVSLLACIAAASIALAAQAQVGDATPNSPIARRVGVVKSVQGDAVTLTQDSGGDIAVTLDSSTKILRVAPGQVDLKTATPLQPQDLRQGDRLVIRGQASPSGEVAAKSVIVMKNEDVAARQQHDRDDWQKRGVGGLVKTVDSASGDITITTGGAAASQVVIHTTHGTVARRYAAGSVNFDDAKPAPLDQIKPGDQLRARGQHHPDGSEWVADEIVSGTFRNIAGTVSTIDVANQSLTVQDAITKKSVVVKITSDSQVKKLPAEMAQRIAVRLKGGVSDTATSATSAGTASAGGQMGSHASGNGAPDVQRLLARLPSSPLTDLQKGDAVMIVSTADTSGTVTAITLLAGVDPILRSGSSQAASTLLSPWSLSGSGGEGDSGQ
jgi:hypothetical protein